MSPGRVSEQQLHPELQVLLQPDQALSLGGTGACGGRSTSPNRVRAQIDLRYPFEPSPSLHE